MSELTDKLNEAKAKLLKKAIVGAKQAGKYLKDQAGKSVDTARNAVVAGAVAPVGAGIAQKYSKPANKEKRYTSADVAALATAMKTRGTSESLAERLLNHSKLLESDNTEKKSAGKTITKATGAGTVAGAAGGAVGLGKVANHLTGGVAGTVAPGLKGSLIRGTRTAAKILGGVRGGIAGAAVGAGAGVAKAIHDKKKVKEKNESLIEALNRLKSIVEEENGLPKKKRELTPEQKARRQERRKLRRQLEKQGLYQKKPRSGAVTTTSGGQKFSNDAIEAAKNANKNAAQAAQAAGDKRIKINLNRPKGAKPANAAKPAQAAQTATQNTQASAQKLTDAAKKMKNSKTAGGAEAAKKVFNKSATFRKFAAKAGRVGALKGAAAAAGAAGALYGAKKLLDKRNKGN